MKTYKQSRNGGPTDHLAGMIAKGIIYYQSLIAGKLNSGINRCSKGRQKCLLIVFSMVFASGLIVHLFISVRPFNGKIDAGQYRAAHIGQSSDLPKPATKPINSLTLKKDHYGK